MSAYTPQYGAMDDISGAGQFSASRVSSLSLRTTPIEFVGYELSHASGFFWVRGERTFLVTNWHVLTWKDPFSGMDLSDSWYRPERIRIFGVTWPAVDDPRYVFPQRTPCEIELFANGKPQWIQHKDFSSKRIDVVALEIPKGVLECRNKLNPGFNGYGFKKFFNLVGADVFAIGYPFKSYVGAMAALWKRGSIASEPLLAVDRRPMFLVDMLGTRGLSGSPIIRRVLGPAYLADGTVMSENVCSDEFVGVYAGRITSSELDRVSLGYIWHGQLVDQILDEGVEGTTF